MWVGALLQSRRITGILGDELAITGETILVGIVDREITGRVIASTLIAFLGGKLDRLLTIDRLNAKEVMIFGRQSGSTPSAFHCGLSKNRLIWNTVLLTNIERGLTILIRI